jgi:hypothetical protein
VGALGVGAVTAPASAAAFTPTAGSYVADTTTLLISGPGGHTTGTVEDGVAVFAFDSVTIPADVTISVQGDRPFRLESAGTLTVAGAIIGDGGSASDFIATPPAGGPGGGAGGGASQAGVGPGGGSPATNSNDGGGGGGFGGSGARGGSTTTSAGVGGPAYEPPNGALRGGSGGAGSSAAGSPAAGGGGGGAVHLVGDSVVLTSSSLVSVDGGGGAVGGGGSSGGGSGGAIVVEGGSIDVGGVLRARGGPGGAGGCCGAGGGGGGGRIVLSYVDSLAVTGSTLVHGGLSGARTTGGCCAAGQIGEPQGGSGVVTKGRPTKLSAGGARTVQHAASLVMETTLKSSKGDPIPSRVVELHRRELPDGAWTMVGSLTTSARGVASLNVRPTSTSVFQWRFGGDASYLPSASPSQKISVAQVVSLQSTRSKLPTGADFKLWGTVKPSGDGEGVELQRRSGGRWKPVDSATLQRQKLPNGQTSVGYVFKRVATRGVSSFRVHKTATETMLSNSSPTVTVEGQ